jgi:hypothetical protein
MQSRIRQFRRHPRHRSSNGRLRDDAWGITPGNHSDRFTAVARTSRVKHLTITPAGLGLA